jgi:pyrroline-5-carboxylate reductase
MGFTPEEGRQLAVQTFLGAAQLAQQSGEPVSRLRERVTSKGGTTAAALAQLQGLGVARSIVAAARAARDRAADMGREFDRD